MKKVLMLGLMISVVSSFAEVYAQKKSGKVLARKPQPVTKQKPKLSLPKVILIDETGLKQVLRPKGKPLLVNFWATWCAPCREEFPDLVKISNEYLGKIDVITISLDDPIEINRDVPKFLARMNAKMPAFLLKAANEDIAIGIVSEKWQGGLPFTILFSTDGKEAYSRFGKFDPILLRREIEKIMFKEASR
ncbi:MAG: TlpA family protein disulfide reductase [Pyrinomonadaceae bacterium]|nr:TlpA family protein disulfide reductase [Pyrinomonadaceae bacterium]MCX7639205.1 TlpA family protein disulfide reductase [Pyrinomonadaceae bacterium]MDW8303573.1 TlpA disulfide reductase family protein [Acidobacteriota bacterium]